MLQHELASPAKTYVGTPVYMAPEIILGPKRYDAKVRKCMTHHLPICLYLSVSLSLSLSLSSGLASTSHTRCDALAWHSLATCLSFV